jgi:CubicO group peptidase (beta-lactamase class C family)
VRLAEAERVLRPGELRHYSNLAFGVLGEIVTRVAGDDFPAYLQAHVLDPLGLGRTSFRPAAPVAKGYYVDPPRPHVRGRARERPDGRRRRAADARSHARGW